jgi:ATP-dependent exoDNAse (exonuclease V) beta subunit
MSRPPADQAARDRFTNDWSVNLAVVANAGSGKTTAISERLAAMALSEGGSEMLRRTAVVTYTKKAATQIGQRARSVLLRRMAEAGRADVEPLARLERAIFGTIHSFCLLLARRHGNTLGIHLNPTLVDEGDDAYWHEFLEQDAMTFASLGADQVDSFLRHASLDEIFDLAQELDPATAQSLVQRRPASTPPAPSRAVLEEILAATPKRKGSGAEALVRNKETASRWLKRFLEETERLPIAKPEGSAAGIEDLYRRFFAPLKVWLADAGGVLAAELSMRYRSWRLDRGIQTYADQVETALAVVEDQTMLDGIRAEGWRVLLDEAQDTDPKQFAVLVEITRPQGVPLGSWPHAGGAGPRPGHFCMVGDAQQGIYSKRADIQNFQRHVDAFAGGYGGERLIFGVTFRAPRRVVRLLNATLPASFGEGRYFNLGLPSADGAPARCLQVPYEPLAPGPENVEGGAWRLPIEETPVEGRSHVADVKLLHEARQVAAFLASGGPGSVGAGSWGDVCMLAPRNAWLPIISSQLEAAGLKTSLQMRRNRNGDNPVYAWLCGLLAVVCDPENAFEWVGVLREIFAVSDALIARDLRDRGGFRWDEPGDHAPPIGHALGVLGPFISRADQEGESLERFAADLARACGLEERARKVDPEGVLEDELARLLARAAELGAGGAGPRAWLRDLLGSIDETRSSGRPERDSINLMTSHSAKGLEWPVVVPVGLWRSPGFREPVGMRLLRDRDGQRVVYDSEGVSQEASQSLERERLREQVRLLYVTLTRSKAALVIPWSDCAPEKNSFAELWGLDPLELDPVPGQSEPPVPGAGLPVRPPPPPAAAPVPGAPAPGLPKRILPHELAVLPDAARAARHESSVDAPALVKDATDPLEYGVWWHETLEFLPWEGGAEEVAAHGEESVAKASERGFGPRALEEWGRLLSSEPWRLMREPRWTRLSEVGIFAPLTPESWIDGVIDLVLHDPLSKELWIVDWKTNRRGAGEGDSPLLSRLSSEYEMQLGAYGSSAARFFPDCKVSLWIYSTVAGRWTRVGPAG